MLSLTSCASTIPTVVTETETVVVEKEIMVPVPDSLTALVQIPLLTPKADTLELGATYKATVIRLMVCNGQLAEIGQLHEQD